MNKANPNFTFLKNNVPKQRFTLLQGGTRSGKTFSTIYYFIWLCENYSGLEIDIVRDTFTALKSTVWKDFKQVLVKHNLYHPNNHNKTDKFYNLNGNIISYYGADDPGKIHGRARDFLWLNEANQLDEETIDQLFPRTRHKIIADYNPAMPSEHWLDSYIDDYPPCITTYKDNPHLTKEQVLDIERKKNNAYWWAVYGTGNRTKPTGVIFNNWDVGEFDESLPYILGMDFGYVNDESTLVKIAVDKRNLFAEELLYEKGLSTDEIVNRLGMLITKNDLIVADNAEPRLIAEIRAKGFNIVPCTKGADSIRLGLVKMMDYKIVVTPESRNLQKELSNYVWNDKKSNTPKSNGYDHLIDACRYAFDELVEDNQFYFS
jgi:phage terminase large subunit